MAQFCLNIKLGLLLLYFTTVKKINMEVKSHERIHDGKNPRVRKENPKLQKILIYPFILKIEYFNNNRTK